jgi:hypothetical protein
MTDRELLLSLRSQIDAQLNPAPWPGPGTPPPHRRLLPTPPTPIPSGNYNGVLTVAGEHFPVPQGPSLWSVPGRTANFAISISGSYAPVTVTILDPYGNVAQQPWGGRPRRPSPLALVSNGRLSPSQATTASRWTLPSIGAGHDQPAHMKTCGQVTYERFRADDFSLLYLRRRLRIFRGRIILLH